MHPELGLRLNLGRGRDVDRSAPPAQIRAGGITAYGSYLGYSGLKRCSG
jgi:hypothetical protein